MPIFVPVPVETEGPPVQVPIHPEYNHGFTLIGGDGSVWDLVAGPVFILAGASGFGFPEPNHRWSESPLFDGAVHRDLHYSSREFELPLEVDGRFRDPAMWRELERAWWKAVNPRFEATLVVTAPSGESHNLPFRYSGGGDDTFDLDPLRRQDNVYALECISGDPFWNGPVVSVAYQLAATPDTFPGPPFNIGDSTAISATTTVGNFGDEEVWPRWTITGPYTTVTVGVADAQVVLETPILNGESRIIEMDPKLGRSIRDGSGVLKWSDATTLDFGTIPVGGEVPLTIAVTGGTVDQTSITLDFETHYLRAFS